MHHRAAPFHRAQRKGDVRGAKVAAPMPTARLLHSDGVEKLYKPRQKRPFVGTLFAIFATAARLRASPPENVPIGKKHWPVGCVGGQCVLPFFTSTFLESAEVMSKLSVLQRSRNGLGAAMIAAALVWVAPAQAVVYQGAWDPAFGSAFPDLGWRGEAEFFVPDACLAESGWVFNFESCSSSGMKLLSAEVGFYKLSDPTNTAFQETLSFDIPSDFVLAMKIDDGDLAGVFGSFLYSRPSTLAIAGGGYTDFVLFFQGDIARMGFVSYPPNGHKTVGLSDVNPPDGRPFITFRAVPEPASLPLFFAALGLLALFSLRRQPTR